MATEAKEIGVGCIMGTKEFLDVYRKYLERNWGERCPTTESGCALCEQWALYDLTMIMLGYDD